MASSPSESRLERADAIFEAILELPARERCVKASRPMVEVALAEIVHDRRPAPRLTAAPSIGRGLFHLMGPAVRSVRQPALPWSSEVSGGSARPESDCGS